MKIESFHHALGHSPYRHQLDAAAEFERRDGPAFLLSAPTGCGKTEAVLLPCLALRKRLVYVLPARSLADDLAMIGSNVAESGRIIRHCARLRPLLDRNPVIVNEHGGNGAAVVVGGDQRLRQCWGSHHYRADVIVTTIDSFLMRFFGFGSARKSYIYPLRIHRPGETVVVFDEAHVYDGAALTNFLRLVRALYEAGIGVVVMTATMPGPLRGHLGYLREVAAGASPPRRRRLFHHAEDEWKDALADLRNDALRCIVVLNTVEAAVKRHDELRGCAKDTLFLYHGRQENGVRQKTLAEIVRREREGRPYWLVTTSAIEVGCDFDADVLVTEVCDPDSLLQRMGRCNRKGAPDRVGTVRVIGETIPDWLTNLEEAGRPAYVDFLKERSGSELAPQDYESLREMLSGVNLEIDRRQETAFSMLYDYVYRFALENEPLHRAGFVATRGWEPTVRVVRHEDQENGDAGIEIEIHRLCTTCERDKKGDYVPKTPLTEGVRIERLDWHRDDDNNLRPTWRTLTYGGSILNMNLRVVLPEGYPWSRETGLVEMPKAFKRAWKNGPRQFLQADARNDEGKEITLTCWYLCDDRAVLERNVPEEGGTDSAEEDEA